MIHSVEGPPDDSAGPLSGIVVPLVTPLTDRDVIDENGAARLIEHVLAGGVAGLFLLGSTGEAPSLSYRLRRQFIRLACDIVDGNARILVGVTDTSFVETIELAEVAKEAGANAVVLSTPYYFPAGQTELVRYATHVAEQTPLPLMLYNMPSLTKVWFEIETLKALVEQPKIIGVKDSSGDIDYFRRLVALKSERPDWSIMVGPEVLLAESLRLGGDGGVNGGANVYPDLFVRYFEAIVAGNEDVANELGELVTRFQEIYSVGKYASRFIKATKCALSLRGICSDQLAEPFNRFLPPERSRVEQILERLAPYIEAILAEA
ncbi:MAG: dihydrodipicolinate synthase family protein [Planctomycetota bacterium]